VRIIGHERRPFLILGAHVDPAGSTLTASSHSAHRAWTWLSWALLALLALVMLATLGDYGISGDAGVQHRWGRRLLRWYATFGNEARVTDNLDITKYGGFCEVVTELVVAVSPLETYRSRNLANVGFALVGFFAVLLLGRRLGGPPGGFLALLFLALTPVYYGQGFYNAKDIPFAALYALAVSAILACDDWPKTSWRRPLGAGVLIGLTAAVRVGGIVLFGFALVLWTATLVLRSGPAGRPAWPARRDLARLAARWLGALAVGWTAMVAFWPWAMLDPLRNPFRAAARFSHYWDRMLIFYDGRLLPTGEVSRFYLPNWLALTLPELYLVAAVLGGLGLALLGRARRLGPTAYLPLLQAGWLAGIPVLLVSGAVINHMPLYDGLRHFLFLIPVLAALAGAGVATFLRAPAPRALKLAGTTALALTCAVTLVDMVRLHPYEAVYFNRLVAGGERAGIDRYEGDYWCLSYKEGCEWLLRRFAGARCREPIKVGSYSILQQTEYYLRQTEEGRRLFVSVPTSEADFVLATTRFQDHLRAPGQRIFTVERLGATLLYLSQVRAPDCQLAGAPAAAPPP
jgi:hypothetical protein